MRYIIFTISFIASVLFAEAQQKDVSYTLKKFSASSIKSLDATTIGGWVRVDGGSQKEASVEVILNPNGNSWRSKDGDLKTTFEREFDLELGVSSGKLVAKVKRKNGKNGNSPLSISYIITVPTTIHSQVKTAGGSIKMNNLKGNQAFSTAGGSLTASNLSGTIDGKTSGGSITATDCDGDIQISTSGGSIRMENLKGIIIAKTAGGSITGKSVDGKLDASTSGGSIRLEEASGDIKAATSGGSVTASVTAVTSPLHFTTSAGSINLTLPKGSYDLDLSGSRVNVDHLQNFSGSTQKGNIKGSLNGGGYAVKATTSAGSVNLSWL